MHSRLLRSELNWLDGHSDSILHRQIRRCWHRRARGREVKEKRLQRIAQIATAAEKTDTGQSSAATFATIATIATIFKRGASAPNQFLYWPEGEPPHLNWSSAMFRKRMTDNDEQTNLIIHCCTHTGVKYPSNSAHTVPNAFMLWYT